MEGSRTAGRKRRRFRFWVAASDENQDRCAISKTGAGFADAKLSEILPSARVARFVRMTGSASGSGLLQDFLRRSGLRGVKFLEQILYIGTAKHLDEADLVVGVEIDDHLSFDRLQLDVVGNLHFGSSREARAILVAAVAHRLDSERAQLGLERIGALLLEQIDHLLEQVGQYVVHHRRWHGDLQGSGFGEPIKCKRRGHEWRRR